MVAQPEHRNLQYISFLGNSMGGLFLRFAFGLLFDRDTGLMTPARHNSHAPTQTVLAQGDGLMEDVSRLLSPEKDTERTRARGATEQEQD